MPKKRPNNYSRPTLEAAHLLGSSIRLARRERRWTLQELADRVGVTPVTMRRVEQGDPTVGLGIAFEAASLTGVPLFDQDASRRSLEARRIEDRLALLPSAVRQPRQVDDAF
jgi:transcriptional regulator with XRE-family HTH domain